MRTLQQTQDLPISPAEAWEFFSNPRNLEEITPPWLKFQITQLEDGEMREGQRIEYRIQLAPMANVRWITRIQEVHPGRKFIDVQLKGPYALWHHTHLFETIPGGIRMRDIVQYRVGWGPIGWIAHRVYVDPSVQKIFDFRRETLEKKFGRVG